jgi:hypothetical protein
VAVTPPAPSQWPAAAAATIHETVAVAHDYAAGKPVARSEALVPVAREAAAMSRLPQGPHAWLGATEGPALRRAARMADRVIVLVSSGGEAFTSLMGLRTRLGRDNGVGLVMLGVSPQLMMLPDRTGDVDKFWRNTQPRSNAIS